VYVLFCSLYEHHLTRCWHSSLNMTFIQLAKYNSYTPFVIRYYYFILPNQQPRKRPKTNLCALIINISTWASYRRRRRIEYMAATLVNKIRSTARPSYLSILLTEYTPARRSSSMRLLQQPSPGVLSVVQLPQFATISSLTFVLPIYS